MTAVLILAGGLGTRLREVVGAVPKPLADVAGKPFLWWLLRRLEFSGVSRAYLSVGYRADTIERVMGGGGSLSLSYIVEDEPLGTGGAIKNALGQIRDDEVVVINGDSLAVFDFGLFLEKARNSDANVVLALAQVNDASRYGTVVADKAGRITAFMEKGRSGPGIINAGVYWMKRTVLESVPLRTFSFETDFLAARLSSVPIAGIECVSDFIDIGVPEDYHLAQVKVPEFVRHP
jgi:D-glycero-alpha-D-manno-heptose 1-phosphate guanylyltransferase